MGSNSSLFVGSRPDLQESWDLLKPSLSFCAAGVRSVVQIMFVPIDYSRNLLETEPKVLSRVSFALVTSAEKLTEDPNTSAPSMPPESVSESLAPTVFNII